MRILTCITILLISLRPIVAQAEEFYLELGVAVSEDEAQSIFAEIQQKNPVLADYDVFPNAILQPDGGFKYRVQAGPMIDRAEATKVCNRLRKKKISCFLIEGFDPQKPATFALKAEEAPISSDFAPPWLDKIPVPPPVTEEENPESSSSSGSSFFGSIASIFDSSSEEKKQAEPTPQLEAKTREAKVDVSEAIPVAVSFETNTPQEVVTVAAPFAIAENSNNNDENAQQGWLNIQPFMDEGRARKFWENLQRNVSGRTAGLEMQVIYPVVSDNVPKVILNIGQFASEAEAMRLCRDYVTPASRYLECSFSTARPEGTNKPAAEIFNRYAADDENSLFWVELLSARSQDTVLEQWEKIRTDNDDMLMNVRSQITTSLSKPGVYVVRVGPLNARSKAEKLCNTLQTRKLSCKVVGL